MTPDARQPRIARRSLALCVLVLLASALLAWQTARVIEQNQQARFDYEVRRIKSAVEKRMQAYVQVLRGGRGLFEASDFVSREDWRVYVESQRLATNYPGIRSMTHAAKVEPQELSSPRHAANRRPASPIRKS
jgi:CHASE1-domain containing sensor protein